MTRSTFAGEFEQATRTAWRELVDKALKGADFDKTLMSETPDGLRVEPLYTREQALDSDLMGVPGAAPFLRGGVASEVATGWDIRERIFATEPEEAKAIAVEALMGGATSITLPVAQPGRAGLDPSVLHDVLEGFDPEIARLAFTPNTIGPVLIDVLTSRFGADHLRTGRFDLNFDPIGVLARTGGLASPVDQMIADHGELLEQTDGAANLRVLALDGRVVHEAGGTPAQELAYVLGSLAAYLRGFEASGKTPADIAPKCVAQVSADADFFPTIAKLRAARVVIWRLLDACGAGDTAGALTLHATTAQRMMSKHDPWVNSLRTTIALTGAAIGGAQAITVYPYSLALGRPDTTARRIARNSQVMLQEESGLGHVDDEAGGSWYVDRLTMELAEHAWSVFQDLEAQGGIVAALSSGAFQAAVATARDKSERRIARGEHKLTGVSAFPQLDERKIDTTPHAVALDDDDPAVTVEPLSPSRSAEPYERLRDAVAGKTVPPVALCTPGDPVALSKQVNEAQSFLASGGLCGGDAVPLSDAVAEPGPVLIAPGPKTDLTTIATDVVRLRDGGARPIMVMARAGEARDALQDAGVTHFVHDGVDAIDILSELHGALGIDTLGH